MNRITYRSTALVFAAFTTIGMLKGISLLFAVPAPPEPMAVARPVIEVVSAPQAVRLASPAR